MKRLVQPLLFLMFFVGGYFLLGQFWTSTQKNLPSTASSSTLSTGDKSQLTGAAGSPLFHTLSSSVSPAFSINPPQSFSELAKKVQPAVVNIFTAKEVVQKMNPLLSDPFYRNYRGNQQGSSKQPNALGTGFIINESGDIITNNHVVEGADEISVKLADGRSFEAKIIGRDEKLDLAVIRLNRPDKMPFVPLGDSDLLQVGDWVMAIGNPFGLGHTVTAGIVSAKSRDIGAGPYDEFIQTDASINPGNSGGPLFNLNGEVIGINSAIIASGQGLGFAIPINIAKEVVPQLISKGSVTRGFFGVAVVDLTQEEGQRLGIVDGKGALVAEVVPNSPAESAGIEKGDVIVEFNGVAVDSSRTIPKIVASMAPGSKASVVLLRAGKKFSFNVTVTTQEAVAQSITATQSTSLGISVRDLSPAEKNRYRIHGILVTDVMQGSMAESIGLQQGDLVLEMNGRQISTVKEFQTVYTSAPKGKVIRVGLARGSHMYYFAFRKE